LVIGLCACAEEPTEPTPDIAGAFLLDAPWQYQSTTLLTTGEETVPLPTDRRLTSSSAQTNTTTTGDALYGSLFMFGADGRLLVKTSNAEDYQDFGARYTVVDTSILRAKHGQGLWFAWEYHYDRASRVLLLNPEPEAADAVVGLVSDALTNVLVTGALDSAAAGLADTLAADPRVKAGISDLLGSAVNGSLPDVPSDDPEAGARWLLGILAPSGILDSKLTNDTLVQRLEPVFTDLSTVAHDKLTDHLVAALLDADVIDSTLSSDRAERVLRFVLYRAAVTTPQNLATIERIEMELDRGTSF
jgi:hypothetical protein